MGFDESSNAAEPSEIMIRLVAVEAAGRRLGRGPDGSAFTNMPTEATAAAQTIITCADEIARYISGKR